MSGIGGVGRGGFDRMRNDASSSGQMAAVPAPAPEAQIVRGTSPAAPGRPAPAPIADPRVAALVQAMRTQSAPELEKTLAAAKKQDPTSYRSAVRELFEQIDFRPSKLLAHIMAMDANNDGKLTFSESYHTMHDMGFSATRAAMLSGLTAVALAPQTNNGKLGFVLDVKNADKTNRAFFRNAFDTEEKLEERLDQLMSEDLDKDGFLTQKDFDRIVDKRTATMDSKLGARIVNYLNKSEWQALLKMMDNNRMNREELKDFYNSSLFFSLLEPDNLAKKLVAYRAGKV